MVRFGGGYFPSLFGVQGEEWSGRPDLNWRRPPWEDCGDRPPRQYCCFCSHNTLFAAARFHESRDVGTNMAQSEGKTGPKTGPFWTRSAILCSSIENPTEWHFRCSCDFPLHLFGQVMIPFWQVAEILLRLHCLRSETGYRGYFPMS